MLLPLSTRLFYLAKCTPGDISPLARLLQFCALHKPRYCAIRCDCPAHSRWWTLYTAVWNPWPIEQANRKGSLNENGLPLKKPQPHGETSCGAGEIDPQTQAKDLDHGIDTSCISSSETCGCKPSVIDDDAMTSRVEDPIQTRHVNDSAT
jgi:hypothetical protein